MVIIIIKKFRFNHATNWFFLFCVVCFLSLFSVFTSDAVENNVKNNVDKNTEVGKIVIIVSVDWEGSHLKEENLSVMSKFRDQFPEIQIQHFINPAYFSRAKSLELTNEEIAKKIKSVLRSGDEQGMHIHAWKELIEDSGVKFKTLPTFHDFNNADKEGRKVPLWIYSKKELIKIFEKGINILVQSGFDKPKSFRAGGWMATKEVLEALAANGICIDCSALPGDTNLLSWNNYNLKSWVEYLWKDITSISQPFKIVECESSSTPVIEVPNNGCLADYCYDGFFDNKIFDGFKQMSKELEKRPTATLYYSIGFHQESAQSHLSSLINGIKMIKKWALKNNVKFEFAKLPLENLIKQDQNL